MLDLEGALKLLAIDKALINNDGFLTRSSDYSLYLDPGGKYHLIPRDANETLRETKRRNRTLRRRKRCEQNAPHQTPRRPRRPLLNLQARHRRKVPRLEEARPRRQAMAKNDQPPLESPYQQAFFDGYFAPRSYRKQCRPRLWAHRPISA